MNQAQLSILYGIAAFVGGAVFLRLCQMDFMLNAAIVAAATLVMIVQQARLVCRYEEEMKYWRNGNEDDRTKRG